MLKRYNHIHTKSIKRVKTKYKESETNNNNDKTLTPKLKHKSEKKTQPK